MDRVGRPRHPRATAPGRDTGRRRASRPAPARPPGLPRWLGTAAVVVTAYLVLAVLAVVIVLALGQFSALLADYRVQLDAGDAALAEVARSLGFDASGTAAVVSGVEPGAVLHVLFAAGTHLLGLGLAVFFVLAYALWIGMDAARLRDLPDSLRVEHGMRVRTFRDFADGTSRYYVVNSIFGALVAVIDGVALALIGVPGAFVWAVLAFVTNYIPNIGFVIGLVPPLVLALVVGGWGQALLVLVVYCLVNVVLQVLVQPRFVAVSVRLSFTLTFLSVVVWAVLLGPIGSILAVPLTLLTRFLLIGGDRDARLARWLSGDQAEPPD
ncbi:AI-2E family transporter [Leifsonia poae]|uniref:AI-2E family transporter n=1 Tax=Leifsonia poae TaxID=110933 RepID=UPI003D68A9B2